MILSERRGKREIEKIQTHIGGVLDVLDAAVGQGDAVLPHDVALGVAAAVLAEVGVVVVVVDTVSGHITTLASNKGYPNVCNH